MDQPLDIYTASIIRLGQQFFSTAEQLARHRHDFTRATMLADTIHRLTGLPAFAAPPAHPLGGIIAPAIVVAHIPSAIPYIEATGHTVSIDRAGNHQINPPPDSTDTCLSFSLQETP